MTTTEAFGVVLPTSKTTVAVLRYDGSRRTIPLHQLDSSRKSKDEINQWIAHRIMGWTLSSYGEWIDSVSSLRTGYAEKDGSKDTPKWTPATNLSHAFTAAREFNQRRLRLRADGDFDYPIPLLYTLTPYFVAFSTHLECLFGVFVDPCDKGDIPFRFCQGLMWSYSTIKKLHPDAPSVKDTTQRSFYFDPELKNLVKLQREHKDKGDAAMTKRNETRQAALIHLADMSPLAFAAVDFQSHQSNADNLARPWFDKKRAQRTILGKRSHEEFNEDGDAESVPQSVAKTDEGSPEATPQESG